MVNTEATVIVEMGKNKEVLTFPSDADIVIGLYKQRFCAKTKVTKYRVSPLAESLLVGSRDKNIMQRTVDQVTTLFGTPVEVMF